MNSFRTAPLGPLLALLLGGAASAQAPSVGPPAAQPALSAQRAPAAQLVPAAADEGPTTTGPLPVAPPADKAAAAPEDDFGAGAPTDESFGGTLLKMLFGLGFVILLVYVSLNWGLRKLMGVKGMPGRAGLVQVVERIPLDPKRTLFVLRAAGEYLLVGGADENLNLISRLDAAQVGALLDEQRQRAAAPSAFLAKLLQKEKASPPADPPPSEPKV